MKYLAYLNGDIKELAKLCLKCLEHKMTTRIITSSFAESRALSDLIWSGHYFVPHTLADEKFADSQYICIDFNFGESDIVINYLEEHTQHAINAKKFIAWGYVPKESKGYAIYSFKNGKWTLVNSLNSV